MLKGRSHRVHWINGLLRLGLVYDLVVLEEVDNSEGLNPAEQWWIAYGRLSGWPLVNHTAGGDGLSGYSLSSETNAKISAAHKGRVATPQAREANAHSQRGRKHSLETRRKMSQSATTRQASAALREHMRRTSTGYKHTAETKQRMRKPRKRPHPPVSNEVIQLRREVAAERSRNGNGTFQ